MPQRCTAWRCSNRGPRAWLDCTVWAKSDRVRHGDAVGLGRRLDVEHLAPASGGPSRRGRRRAPRRCAAADVVARPVDALDVRASRPRPPGSGARCWPAARPGARRPSGSTARCGRRRSAASCSSRSSRRRAAPRQRKKPPATERAELVEADVHASGPCRSAPAPSSSADQRRWRRRRACRSAVAGRKTVKDGILQLAFGLRGVLRSDGLLSLGAATGWRSGTGVHQ